jgi:hypothetical protein
MTALNKDPHHAEPVFTRYLYEKLHVKYSLLWAMTSGEREESLFWAYELYHSGFQEYAWNLLSDIYAKYYEDANPRFKTWFDKLYGQWQESADPCLLGSAVGTLAKRSLKVNGENPVKEKFLILYREDRHKTLDAAKPTYRYLEKVSKYAVRSQAQYTVETVCGLSVEKIREAYLGPNWLFYCRKTPVWLSRIGECRGAVDEERRIVAFKSDDDLEAFYERWGFEPDEQSKEMHICHGIYI